MGNAAWIFISIGIAIIAVAFFSIALWLVRKCVCTEKLKEHHDVAGFLFGTIGVLYSVVLGFTVVNAKERYDQAESTVHTEATMLADLYRDSAFFPDENRETIRASLRGYVKYVLDEEWFGKRDHLRAQRAINNLWDSYRGIDLSSESVKIWYAQSVSKIDNLMNARLARQFYSHERLGSMMWTLLLVGGFITISFVFFFGLNSLRNQMLMTSLLVCYLSFMLYLVYCLDDPFHGAQAIQPTALEESLVSFDELDQGFKSVNQTGSQSGHR